MSFIEDLHTYISGEFIDIDFTVGELLRETEGVVLAIAPAFRPPDLNTGVAYEGITLWVFDKSSKKAFDLAEELYGFFHQKHHYQIGDYKVYWSNAEARPEDGGRSSTGMKITRVPIMYITGLNIIS